MSRIGLIRRTGRNMSSGTSGMIGSMIVPVVIAMIMTGCSGAEHAVKIDNARSVSESIRDIMIRRSYSAVISFTAWGADDDSIRAGIYEMMQDAFYESPDPRGGDYLYYQYGGYRLETESDRGLIKTSYTIRIIPDYYTTASEEAEVDGFIMRAIEDMELSEDASEYDRICAVRDYILRNVEYDTVHYANPGSRHTQSTAYGALKYHQAMCQGYSVLAYRLLKELGIDNRIIRGTTTVNGAPEAHVWNIIRIGEKYYNCDLTLDDVTGTGDYFLKSDGQFASDHVRDESYASEEFERTYVMSEVEYIR